MKRTRLKPVSKSQTKKNHLFNKVKQSLSPYCCICGAPAVDPAHLLPRSTYPEHYYKSWNVAPMCRIHHVLFDESREFRKSCTELIEQVRQHDEEAANRHFGL